MKNKQSLLKNHSWLFSLLTVIGFYGILLTCYLLNMMNSFTFVGIMLISTLIPLVFIIIHRKSHQKRTDYLIMFTIIVLLTIYELPLTEFEGHTYAVSGYNDPEQLIDNSGIFILSVGWSDIYYINDEEEIWEIYDHDQKEIYELTKITNQNRYKGKWTWIKSLIGLHKEDFQVMKENVHDYVGNDVEVVNQFLKRENMEGDSAGLALGLTAMIVEGELDNNLKIGVTGTLEKDGSVRAVGSINEKMQIAAKNSIQHIIVPEANRKEAEVVNENFSLDLQIHSVNHIEVAVDIINHMNKDAGIELNQN